MKNQSDSGRKRRSIKPFIYLFMVVVSLYSLSRVVDPLLTLASGEAGAVGDGLNGLVSTVIKEKTQEVMSRYITGTGTPEGSLDTLDLDQLTGQLSGQNPGDITSLEQTLLAGLPREKGSQKDDEMIDINSVELDPELEQALLNSAVGLHNQGKLDEAIAAYYHLLSKNPNHAASYANLAVAYLQKSEYEKAWQAIHKSESLGRRTHKQFRADLEEKMSEPGR